MMAIRVTAVVMVVAACGDDTSVMLDAPDPSDAQTTTDAEQPATCEAGTFPWTVTFRQDAKAGPTLAGVHACVVTHPSIPCVDTSIDGEARFCVPQNSDIAISAEKAGLMSIIIPYVTSTSQPDDTRARVLTMNVPNCVIWSSGGVSCPPSTSDPGGMLHIGARQNMPGVETDVNYPVGYPDPLGDVQVELIPPSLIEPFYIVNGMKDPNLTATHPATGNAVAGDVIEGDQQVVKLTRTTGGTCHAFSYNAWPGTEAGTIRVPIRRGFRTFAAVTCD